MSRPLIKTVNILKTTEEGQEIIGSVLLVDGEIHYLNLSETFIEELDNGITGLNEKKYTKKDGVLFLENLQYAYSGSYIRASEILTE